MKDKFAAKSLLRCSISSKIEPPVLQEARRSCAFDQQGLHRLTLSKFLLSRAKSTLTDLLIRGSALLQRNIVLYFPYRSSKKVPQTSGRAQMGEGEGGQEGNLVAWGHLWSPLSRLCPWLGAGLGLGFLPG